MEKREANLSIVLISLAIIAMLVIFFRASAEEAVFAEEPEIHPPVAETVKQTWISETHEGKEEEAFSPEILPKETEEPKEIAEAAGAEAAEAAREIDPRDLEMLACVIYQEAGSDYISDETRYMVGDVVLTRIGDPRFPGAMEAVLTQPGQYGEFYWTGVRWSGLARYEPDAVARAYDTARDLLADARHSALYGKGYVWEAEFPQGVDVIYADGLYFGR